MRWDEVVSMALSAGGRRWRQLRHASPAGGDKFLTRLRAEDNSLVLVGVSFDEREILVESTPDVFHFTDHYRDYPAVLARLDVIAPDALMPFLYRTWRKVAGKRILAAWDARPGTNANVS